MSDALRITGTALPRSPDGPPPCVFVDAASRPDVADLARVVDAEDDNWASHRWGIDRARPGKPARVALILTAHRPTRCEFVVEFGPPLAAFLASALQAGQLIVSPAAPTDDADAALEAALVWPLDNPPGLADVLTNDHGRWN